MTWKSIKMNLIIKITTTWPILQVGFEPWLLSDIGYLYSTQIINQTWLEKLYIKMNLIIKGTTTWFILQVRFEPWLLSGIGYLYSTQIINQTWLEKV